LSKKKSQKKIKGRANKKNFPLRFFAVFSVPYYSPFARCSVAVAVLFPFAETLKALTL
jgi:hypothetical protein